MRSSICVLFLFCVSTADAMPTFSEVRDSFRKSDAVLLDRHGRVIHELRVDPKGRRLEWTGIRDISPALIRAVLGSEDRRFYEHRGVDWRAAGYSALRNLLTGSRRGASTITMQLVSMIDKEHKPKSAKRTFGEKWDQAGAARELERSWTKDEILEAYLNLITFRGELQGVSAAARGLFDKEPNGIDVREALLLASLIRSPNAPMEAVARRACLLSESMKASAACEDISALAREILTGSYRLRQRASLAPQIARMLLRDGKASAVSTLDGGLQLFAAETLKYHLSTVGSQNVKDGAVLVADNKTGEVLAYVGSAGGEGSVRYVDGVRAGRQAGSTLKPFLYALAFEKRMLSPASILNDSPLDVPTATGIYKPENYENDFKGLVSARTALASSLNIPAVRVIGLTGVGPFVERLRDLGFERLESDDYYGPSIALGSADVSLYELVNAYRTLANGGVWSELRMAPEKTQRRQGRVFSGEAAFLVSDILSDREARSATFGLENPLSTRFWSAVKTGTSKDMRDNWCVGYSGKYTVGVWVGNFSGEAMWSVSGVTGAAPVWLEIMNRLHRDDASAAPGRPESVKAERIEFEDGLEPARLEVFEQGMEHSLIARKPAEEKGRITYPANGAVIALDPDIPEENQRIFFEAKIAERPFRWVMDNEDLGAVHDEFSWKPKNGRHVLALVDARDRVVDSVKFEVRGTVSAGD